ncbi:MAG: hypothetical protein LBD75_07895 [Candidatus Peribacteria bacterium]|jgi:hypothetical protein|nr:hypothetical protein [Candidatus Peribacteria bacterium]
MMLNQADISSYKSLPKRIQGKPKLKVKNQKSHIEQDFTLLSEDGKHTFLVFMRKNVHLPNSFSIGLRLKTEDGSIVLFRYNGKHGEHKDKQGTPIH